MEHANEDQRVDLIASGYEWMCPNLDCEEFNHEIEASETVTCRHCRQTFEVGDILHAFS